MLELSDHEVRVLGVLLEKQRTTPDDYPLTTNSVMRACNQSTSRDPIVRYEVDEVEAALRSLRERNLTRVVHSPSNRAATTRARDLHRTEHRTVEHQRGPSSGRRVAGRERPTGAEL